MKKKPKRRTIIGKMLEMSAFRRRVVPDKRKKKLEKARKKDG